VHLETGQPLSELPSGFGERSWFEEYLIIVRHHLFDLVSDVKVYRFFQDADLRARHCRHGIQQSGQCARARCANNVEANLVLVERAKRTGGKLQVWSAAADEKSET
jgi:hypothetical protein